MEFPRTFTLPTLFWATAVVAAFCGAYVWIGGAGLVIFVAMAVGIFGGLYASSMLDLDFAFSDLRVDIAKCFVVSAVVCGVTYALIISFGVLGAGVLPICWLVSMKICWFDLERPALILIFVTSFLAPAIAAAAVRQMLGAP